MTAHSDWCDRLLAETFLRSVEHHPEIDSTNTRAMHWLCDAPERPALVLADRQTTGRGRGANTWWAADGALTFSLVLGADSVPAGVHDPRISLITALAVADSLERDVSNPPVRIKWPNDVYLGEKKICGILLEVPPQRPGNCIIGIGINVNNSFGSAPAEIRHSGTSLADEVGRDFDRLQLLIQFLHNMDGRIAELVDTPRQLPERWQSRCLLHNRRVELRTAAAELTGVCRGIREDGALLLDTADCRHTVVSAEQVRLVPDEGE